MSASNRIARRLAVEALEDRTVPSQYEVWAIDRSNTRDENGNGLVADPVDSGGTVYVYDGDRMRGRRAANATPEVIDLGGAARELAVAQTGTPAIRPHMHFFNTARTHAVIAYVSSGHVLFLGAATRTPVKMIDVGVQAHAAFPAPDDSYVIVANQNGKMLHRIWTDYATNTFTLDPVALDLAVGTTPSGAPRQDPVLRPDTAPICGIIEPTSRLAFVTLRGGGLFVVDASGPELRIVNEYDRATIHPDGCGGVIAGDKLYINSGGPGESDLYAFRLSQFDTTPDAPNTPARALVYSQDGPPATTQVDSHGGTLVGHGRYLWVADRWANKIVVVDTKTDRVVNEMAVAGELSADPAPDLLAASPDGNRVYATFRGPVPLTANNPAFNNAVGSTPLGRRLPGDQGRPRRPADRRRPDHPRGRRRGAGRPAQPRRPGGAAPPPRRPVGQVARRDRAAAIGPGSPDGSTPSRAHGQAGSGHVCRRTTAQELRGHDRAGRRVPSGGEGDGVRRRSRAQRELVRARRPVARLTGTAPNIPGGCDAVGGSPVQSRLSPREHPGRAGVFASRRPPCTVPVRRTCCGVRACSASAASTASTWASR
jgi:DNA-binding beta-propeller fold protein YncE